MKRVNLLEYFELAEQLHAARSALTGDKLRGGFIWVHTYELPLKLGNFCKDDNGFSTSKRAAAELSNAIQNWISLNLMDNDSSATFSAERFDVEFSSWQLEGISAKIDAFKSVFATECADVDVYSVGQIAIYRTSALVANGEDILPKDIQDDIPTETLIEFNSAGKCLAFDLPTACGFHALRAVEIVMDDYLKFFGQKTNNKKTWSDYIKAVTALIEDAKAREKPSEKVAAMLDRMRVLDRNPLMHPRDTLDAMQADTLFKLCAITVTEIARDMKAKHIKRYASAALPSPPSPPPVAGPPTLAANSEPTSKKEAAE